jgi:hypothetical protein
MFIKEYVGSYYRNEAGLTGEEPLNLVFHNIRAMVPTLVMRNPINKVVTPILQNRPYAELLSLGLNTINKQMKLDKILRGWVTAALFGWGIIKVGLCAKGEFLEFGDMRVDPGQIYAALIDLDMFVLDPLCRSLEEALFQGHRTMVPRQLLLDTEGYDHDEVAKLPPTRSIFRPDYIANMTRKFIGMYQQISMQDMVDVVELYVPESNVIVTIPDPYQTYSHKYIGVVDYEGPKEGPYVHLSFTPPVPGNPFPVAPVSMWFDLHRMANRMLSKIMDQADRQKDVLVYNPAQADEAQEIVDARDGDSVMSTNPEGVKVISYGGQERNNEIMLNQLQMWYNYISGNPDATTGNMTAATKGSQDTATRAQIMQANAGITVEDAKGILYDATAEVNRRFAWYLHYDPFINLPMIKRTTDNQEMQVSLTPEQRCGEFDQFNFEIVARSMSPVDPGARAKALLDFCSTVLPAAVASAMQMMQLGQQFNLQLYLGTVAEEMGISDLLAGIFEDPLFIQKMQLMVTLGIKDPGKGTYSGGGESGLPNTMAGILQNGGSPVSQVNEGFSTQVRQNAQEVAAVGPGQMNR